jgi:hypothetical protein
MIEARAAAEEEPLSDQLSTPGAAATAAGEDELLGATVVA